MTETQASGSKKFPWWIYWLGLAVIAGVMLWPFVPLAWATNVAEANGCSLNEGSVSPCMVDGRDVGRELYGMAMMGWFLIGTIPLGVFAFMAWMTSLTIHRTAWRRARRS